MARIRSVSPDICTDDVLCDVSAEAERTFVRLWTHLDDEGRCVDNPRLIKAALYPLHDDMSADRVDEDLAELAHVGLLIRYTVGGKPYLSAKPEAWADRQRPRHKTESKLPGPDQADPPPPAPERLPLEAPDGLFTADRRSASDTRPDPGHVVVGVGVVGVVGDHRAAGDRVPADDDTRFSAFWEPYPRKVAKVAARKAWWARKRAGVDPDEMEAAAKGYAAYVKAKGTSPEHMLHGSTFLGPDERWRDFLPDGAASAELAQASGGETYRVDPFIQPGAIKVRGE